MAIRADVPVAIDLLECFWKGLKGEELTVEDLKEVDAVTYSLTQKLIEVRLNMNKCGCVQYVSLTLLIRFQMKLHLMNWLMEYFTIKRRIQMMKTTDNRDLFTKI